MVLARPHAGCWAASSHISLSPSFFPSCPGCPSPPTHCCPADTAGTGAANLGAPRGSPTRSHVPTESLHSPPHHTHELTADRAPQAGPCLGASAKGRPRGGPHPGFTSSLTTLSRQHFGGPSSCFKHTPGSQNRGRAASAIRPAPGQGGPGGEPGSPDMPLAQAGLWVRSPGLFSSLPPKAGPQPRSPRAGGLQEACSLTHCEPCCGLRLLTPPPHSVPCAAQRHQLAKHVAKHPIEQQQWRRRRRPGNSSTTRERLAGTREGTSLEKPRKGDFSCSPGFSGAVTTCFWKPCLLCMAFFLAWLWQGTPAGPTSLERCWKQDPAPQQPWEGEQSPEDGPMFCNAQDTSCQPAQHRHHQPWVSFSLWFPSLACEGITMAVLSPIVNMGARVHNGTL